ncbi:hypothetical protein [Herbaspirillum chlorophenolicum]|uniref:hypothetical protein n=1 Tax=Herbaspirillum chlorophenolicum TaxID=211589 RepID=UPI0014710E50|nr:hypothetical protein [Herbaspirillum chlorophenolicum]
MHASLAERLAQFVVQRREFGIAANDFFVGGTCSAAIEAGGKGWSAGKGAMRSEDCVKGGFLHGVGEMTLRVVGIERKNAPRDKRERRFHCVPPMLLRCDVRKHRIAIAGAKRQEERSFF